MSRWEYWIGWFVFGMFHSIAESVPAARAPHLYRARVAFTYDSPERGAFSVLTLYEQATSSCPDEARYQAARKMYLKQVDACRS